MTDTTIGALIRARRERVGMTMAELARRAEISRSYLYAIEDAQTLNPSFDVVMRLAWELEDDPIGWWSRIEGKRFTGQSWRKHQIAIEARALLERAIELDEVNA